MKLKSYVFIISFLNRDTEAQRMVNMESEIFLFAMLKIDISKVVVRLSSL